MSRPDESEKSNKGPSKLEGIMSGLNELLERLSQVSEQAQSRIGSGAGQPSGPSGEEGKERPKGVFGFSMKVGGLGGGDVKAEPFGNIRRNRETGETVVEDVREPLVDLFDEESRVLVVAEMPGVDIEDVKVSVEDGTLELSAQHGDRKYRKRMSIPAVKADAVKLTGQNGIFEITCPKS